MFAEQRIKEFETFVEKFMSEQKSPGCSIAIAQGDEIVYSRAFGYRNLSRKLPATTDTLYGIASISKSFTAVAIAQLVERGKLSFDDPITKYLPEFKLPGNICADKVTIHHMLTHSTGIPPLPALGISIKDNTAQEMQEGGNSATAEKAPAEKDEMLSRPPINTYSELIDYIGKYQCRLFGNPGEYLSYSNECYGILGAIIMKISGLTYSEYIRRNIFAPLGMNRAVLSFEEVREYDDATELYYKNDGDDQVRCSTRWQAAPPYLAGGWIKCCSTDLIRLFQAYAGEGEYKGTRLLSKKMVEANLSQQIHYSQLYSYAHGLKVQRNYHGVTLIEHGGSLKGVSSNAGFIPEKGISVVVLCNLSGVPISKVWMAGINLALGLPIETPRTVFALRTWTPELMVKYTGKFASGEGAEFSLIVEDGELVVKFKNDSCIIKSVDEATGHYILAGQENEIRFYMDELSKVWGVGIGVR
ncbi:MAG: serine hydrolase domain-containing protein, partial [bacterium]|nr:serine hydrolase domain-containing protein [bacterium]